ncbi:DUF6504 family protein [Geochorda subterranea]|uniref:DUF6504 family protein n=1 Tax=Geochorda subterranea TaxID=3109564 RepID=A0ABZ1BMP3_9FIRM|nr:DUF6504 family protein [Limnochorda sp. LNt]WRP14095.1 DUF6504 family protein [Limnochorda sp. LNt]
MSRRIEQPVEVVGTLEPGGSGGGTGASIVWGHRRLRVLECLAEWREAGRWWDGEAERRVVRVLTEGGIYELSCDAATGRWTVERVLD